MVVCCMITRDRRYRVMVHDDQTAELWYRGGYRIIGRVRFPRVTDQLVALGYGVEDLVRD